MAWISFQPHPMELLGDMGQMEWRWFRYVSPSYCILWPSLIIACFRFLLDHVSGSYCSTCQFSIGTYVVLQLDHVTLIHWTKYRILIGPRGCFLFDHESQHCTSTFCFFIRPHGFMTSIHVLDFKGPHVMSWLFHVSCTGSSTRRIFIWSRGLSWFYHVEYNQFVIEVIRDHHYCTNWLQNYLA
jgi:hypothetical protein